MKLVLSRSFLLCLFASLALLTACDDDDSNSFRASDSDNGREKSSSSQKAKSSSSSRSLNLSASDAEEFLNPDISYGEITDKRDGHVYKTVKIGDQTWMAQNLNYRYVEKTSTLDSSSFCEEDDPKNCEKFGRAYLWSAVMDSAGVFSENGKGCGTGEKCIPKYPVTGICPEGFHVPNALEYKKLIYTAGGIYKVPGNVSYYLEDGSPLISPIGGDGKMTGGTDDYGFSTIYAPKTNLGMFWTSLQDGLEQAYHLSVFPSGIGVFSNGYKKYGFYLRCIKTEDDLADAIYLDLSNDYSEVKPCRTDEFDSCKYGSFVDSRDGQEYKTVQLGYMIWMTENLRYRYLQPSSTEDSTSSCYDNDPKNCEKEGRLYSWSAAMDSAGIFSDKAKGCGFGVKNCTFSDTGFIRGVCPEGWHLPGFEINQLARAARRNQDVFSEKEDNSGGAFAFGFDFPNIGIKGTYWEEPMFAYMWTSFSTNAEYAEYMELSSYFFDIRNDRMKKSIQMPVRCVRHFDNYSPKEPDVPVSFPTYDASLSVAEPCGDECRDSIVDERDGNVYETVKIGNQWWMNDNLRMLDVDKHCSDECARGAEYSWSVAMDSAGVFSSDGLGCGSGTSCPAAGKVRGICPKGWHLPTREEFWTLMASSSNEPKVWKADLRKQGFEHRSVDYRIKSGERIYKTSCYWSSTEMSDSTASRMCIYADVSEVMEGWVVTMGVPKSETLINAVRCVKD